MGGESSAPADRQPSGDGDSATERPSLRRRNWLFRRAGRAPMVAAKNAALDAAENAAPSDNETPADGTPPSERQPSGERGFWALVARASLLVGLCTGIVTLVYLIWPNPTPTPVKKAEMPKPRLGASSLTFEQYLKLVGLDPGNLPPEELARRGSMVQFTVEATGYKGEPLKLRWQLVDVGTNDQILESDAITVRPGADTDRLSPNPIFAPLPERGGPFRVHGELFAPDGVSIADADTGVFGQK